MFKKNTAVTGFLIGNFIKTSDGSVITTGTPTCKRILDGTGAACTNAASYNADALGWEIDLAAGDLNGDMVGLSFTLTDCQPISYTIRTSTKLVSDLVDAAAAPSASDIKTALEADGAKLDHLWEMTEDDGGVRRLTTNALEQGPTGGSAPTVQNIVDGVFGEAKGAHAGFLTTLALEASITTLINRLGAWTGTGINTVLGAFKALLSKAASTPSDIGGTFDASTDSTEAIRDNMGGTPLTAQEVRDASKLAPTAGAAAAGSIDAQLAAIAASGSGSGTGSYTDTITDGANTLDGVRVQLSTDSAGSNRVYETFTDALGVFTLNPDPGTYYRWLDLAGYTFTQGVEVEVT
jgi:hypothetical protein